MNPVTTTRLSTTLIFDYGGQENNMRMNNLHENVSSDNLLDFAVAVNRLQRVNAVSFFKETRTELSV